MKGLRTLVCSGIFIGLTAVKLLSPALGAELRGEIAGVISRNDDYRAAVETLGRRLNDFMRGEEAVEVSKSTGLIFDPVTIEELRAESVSRLPEPKESPASAPAPEPTPEPIPEAVQTFLAAQAEFSEYEVPAEVSYDYPELPFEYTPPVSGYTSSGFGYRLHPIQNEIKYHYGTDYAAQSGDEVYAFAAGTVETAGEEETFGKYIIISHADGYRTLYAHCGSLSVSAGESVAMGQKIALVGQTGAVTGPHLHFELTKGTTYYNPEFYV